MKIYGGKRTSINYLKRSLPGQEQLKELEIFFQCLLSIVHTTLSFNLNSIIVILCGVVVEKLSLTGYSSFRTVLLVLTFSRYDADANRLFRQLNWKDLSTQFQIQKALMVYKSLNDLVPGYLSPKFVKRYETRYSLRDSVNKVIVPLPRTNFMKNSFSYSGAVLWNSLPCDMREAKCLSQFKRLAHTCTRHSWKTGLS